MKLATPLTFADTGRTRFAHVVLDANGRIVPLADLVADHARLTADLELCQQAREALLVKDTLLATCACAIDGPDDICMHHSPKLSKAVADLADAVALLKECRQEFYDICHSSGDPADPAYTSSPAHLYRDCAALVARVEART